MVQEITNLDTKEIYQLLNAYTVKPYRCEPGILEYELKFEYETMRNITLHVHLYSNDNEPRMYQYDLDIDGKGIIRFEVDDDELIDLDRSWIVVEFNDVRLQKKCTLLDPKTNKPIMISKNEQLIHTFGFKHKYNEKNYKLNYSYVINYDEGLTQTINKIQEELLKCSKE